MRHALGDNHPRVLYDQEKDAGRDGRGVREPWGSDPFQSIHTKSQT